MCFATHDDRAGMIAVGCIETFGQAGFDQLGGQMIDIGLMRRDILANAGCGLINRLIAETGITQERTA